jgi:EpsI family protein
MRLLLGLGVLVLAEVGLRTVDSATAPLPAKLPQHSLEAIPAELGAWKARDLPLDPAIFKHSGAAAMLNRAYSNAIGDEIVANVGIWLGDFAGTPHSPELCYPGAGWEIVSRKHVSVPNEKTDSPAHLITFDKSGQRLYVLYWYQYGDRVIFDASGIRAFRQSLRGTNKSMPPIVKVMLQSGNADPVIGEQQLIHLASRLLSKLEPYKNG